MSYAIISQRQDDPYKWYVLKETGDRVQAVKWYENCPCVVGEKILLVQRMFGKSK